MLKQETMFHLGHEFSEAMAEVVAVDGLPLADLLHPGTPATLAAYIDAMEQKIATLPEGSIELLPSLLLNTGSHREKQAYLCEALLAFYETKK